MKADKGNSFVIISHNDYESEVNDFLTNNDVKIDNESNFYKFNAVVFMKNIVPAHSTLSAFVSLNR